MNTRSHKVVLLGDSGVGKSSLAHRIKFHSFPTDPASTIGCEFFAKTWSTSEDEECKFLIWDTSGQEVFRTFTPQFCRGAQLGLVFYDSTTSLDEAELVRKLSNWIAYTPENCQILLVPTKSDLVTPGQEPKTLCDKLFVKSLHEVYTASPVSAKEDTGVDGLLTQMAHILKSVQPRPTYRDTVVFDDVEEKGCCSI